MFERFSSEARQVVTAAGRYAIRSRSSVLDTDHLLFAVVAEDNRAVGALLLAGVTETTIRSWALVTKEPEVPGANQGRSGSGQIPFTVEAKAALEAAAMRADQQASVVTPPDILLGLIDVADGAAVQLLTRANADVGALRGSLTA